MMNRSSEDDDYQDLVVKDEIVSSVTPDPVEEFAAASEETEEKPEPSHPEEGMEEIIVHL